MNWIDPWGLSASDGQGHGNQSKWINNGDGTYTAQKGATLWGLQQQTGKSWQSFGYSGNPKDLQPGDIVGQKRSPASSTVGKPPANFLAPWELSASGGKKNAPVGKDSVKATQKKQSTFQSWYSKKTGEKLTPAEQKMQKSIGTAEMVFGPIAGVVSAEATGGGSVIFGYYVMADGAYLYAEADNKRKAWPFFFFAGLQMPSIIEVNNRQIPFVSPY